MAGFDPYDKGHGAVDWDSLLKGALTLLQIATALFGAALLVAAFMWAMRVFEFAGSFAENPGRMSEYIQVAKQGDAFLPPVEESPREPAESPAPNGEPPARAIGQLKRATSLNSADVFERTADRVLVILLMVLYAIIPLGTALVGLKILVAMLSRKPSRKEPARLGKHGVGEDGEALPDEPDAQPDDAVLPRRIG
ncbi:MAG TPA: hypothetical protein PLM14_00175 [Candidatus Hydrogenedentes bacterium]|nr:hypothetical protein [Candidatus Hydrogenedentota bacterium]HQH50925.1 hypothetical protein [Candidatus Hydrogenedentota bacterium]